MLAALEWSHAEEKRLSAVVEPFDTLAKKLEAGEPLDDISDEMLEHGVAALRSAAEAQLRHARLLSLILAAMPQWDRRRGMTLGDALRRFWPTPLEKPDQHQVRR